MKTHAYELKVSKGHAVVWVGPTYKLDPSRRYSDLLEVAIVAKGCKGFKVEPLTADFEELAAAVRLALAALLRV